MKSIIMRITFISLSILLLFISIPSCSAAERRIALVIGNGNYESGRLRNSVNDANDIAAALQKLDFSVILKNDAGHKEMETAIKELGKKLKKDDVGLFFYAGHGVQIEGQNYLIPIGANIEEESDVKYRAVNLSRILDVMDSAGNRLNIIILDACRNNPYAKSFRSTSRGLAIVEKSPKDTLIAYSTSPNQVAIDGSGRNSPYTKALLDNMTILGIPIEQVFKKVRNCLDNATGGKQVPWYISSLGGDFYFNTERIKQSEEEKQLAEEKRRLEVERKAIEEEHQKINEQKRKKDKEKAFAATNQISKEGNYDAEKAFLAALQFFEESNYDKARSEFQNFLTTYPDSKHSDTVQFWIGECYFKEKKYEQAILEYEKVAKNYPNGSRVPYALLMQGLSFLELGDKKRAKSLLQQVIKDYPNSIEARIARYKFYEIK